jgi:hypothetical protein
MGHILRELTVFALALEVGHSYLKLLVFVLRNDLLSHTFVSQWGLKIYYYQHYKTPVLYKKDIF